MNHADFSKWPYIRAILVAIGVGIAVTLAWGKPPVARPEAGSRPEALDVERPEVAVEAPAPVPAMGRTVVRMSVHLGYVPVPFTYKPNGSQVFSEQRPAGVRVPPPGSPVLYATVPFEGRNAFMVALIPHPRQGTSAQLYVDRNRDGDFGNDEPRSYTGTGTSLSAADITCDYIRADGTTYPYQMWFWTSIQWPYEKKDHWFNFYQKCWKEGQLRLQDGGRTNNFKVWVGDTGNLGSFPATQLVVDWNGNGRTEEPETMGIGDVRRHGSTRVTLEAIAPYADALTFNLQPAGPGDEAVENVRSTLSREPIVGNLPPLLDVPDLDGRMIRLDDYKGKVLLIDFWATWCGPCLKSLPKLKDLYTKFGGRDFEIVGISLDGDVATLRTFCKTEGIAWRQSCDGKEWETAAAARYRVTGIPAAFLVGRDGRIAATDVNAAAIERELAKPQR